MSRWLEDIIFQSEALPARSKGKNKSLPEALKKARRIEADKTLNMREVFYKQGKLLANYNDTFVYKGAPNRFYPSYQSLTDRELRGYFAWRTRFRKGSDESVPLAFLYLHCYELINNIGVSNPTEGYARLGLIMDLYGGASESLGVYLRQWQNDYVIYYNLDSHLLTNPDLFQKDANLDVLDNVANEEPERVMAALKGLVPGWLRRSKFYAEHSEDMDAVIVNVLRRMERHYAKSCKKSLVEQFFGTPSCMHYNMFPYSLFCDPLKRKNYTYKLGSSSSFRCEDGYWIMEKRLGTPRGARKLEQILKAIDAMLRQATGYGHPIKCEVATRWILSAINEEISSQLTRKTKKPLTIDFASLAQIRDDAEETRDRLIVEEEMAEPAGQFQPAQPVEQARAVTPADSSGKGGQAQAQQAQLTGPEQKLLRSLLYGGDLDWIRAEGHLLSVLVDGINEKLYDIFADTVLDDAPALVGDYIDRLKEMFPE